MKPSPEAEDLFEAGRRLRAPAGTRERLHGRVLRRVGIGTLVAGSAVAVTSVAKSGAAAAGAGKPSLLLVAGWIALGTVAGFAGAEGWKHLSRGPTHGAPSSPVSPGEPVPTREPSAALPEESPPTVATDEAQPAPAAPRTARKGPDEAPHRANAVRPADPPAEPAANDPNEVRTDDLRVEIGLLHRAQEASSNGEPSRALGLLDEHASRFPKSVLSQERRATRVFALCAAGRARDARREASSFLVDYPKSPFAPRVRDACAGGSPPP